MNHPAPIVCGVYMLFKEHRLTYVGKSRNCYARVAEHRSCGRDFDHVQITACAEADLAWVEGALIKAFEPQQNKAGRAKGAASPVVRQLRPLPDPPLRSSLPSDPLMAVALGRAKSYASEYRLGQQFVAAVEAGEVPVFVNGYSAGKPRRFITAGALRDWCEGRQRERLAA